MLGSSLRKGLYLSLGTIVGALATVLLFALFSQDRVGLILGLSGWCAMCAFVGSQLRFFATYGSMPAGYTAAILAGDLVNSPDQTFDVALARVAAILVGIAVTIVVLTVTQFGTSRMDLASMLRGMADEALSELVAALAPPAARPFAQSQDGQDLGRDNGEDRGRAVLSRLVALDAVVDQAAGEALRWRLPLAPVRSGQDGLFACIAEAERLRSDNLRQDTVWHALPAEFRRNPVAKASTCRAAAEALLDASLQGVPLPVSAGQTAGALMGVATALDLASWLEHPSSNPPPPSSC